MIYVNILSLLSKEVHATVHPLFFFLSNAKPETPILNRNWATTKFLRADDLTQLSFERQQDSARWRCQGIYNTGKFKKGVLNLDK